MSSPTSADTVLVRPEAVTGLASELASLAAELYADADRCRVGAGGLSTALDGHEGWTAGAAATAWAGLEELLAEQAAALARTLTAAVDAYAAADTRIAEGIDPGRPTMPR
jgi:hypothetical protein